MVDVGPLQPALLDDVLRVGRRAEQLVGDGEEQTAGAPNSSVLLECSCREATAPADVEGSASGRSPHASAKPCDPKGPIAMFIRAAMFAIVTKAVSSIRAGAPRLFNNLAESSSVTVGGVWLMASAYSITSRSRGVKTWPRASAGTSRALSTSRPSWWAMK